MSTITTRMGDGYTVEMTQDELRTDLGRGRGRRSAAARSRPRGGRDRVSLRPVRLARRIVGVERGHEVDRSPRTAAANTLYSAQLSSGVGIPLAREQAFRIFERAFGFDTMEIGHTDYSFKPAKPHRRPGADRAWRGRRSTHDHAGVLRRHAQHGPLLPARTGPYPNPADLLP